MVTSHYFVTMVTIPLPLYGQVTNYIGSVLINLQALRLLSTNPRSTSLAFRILQEPRVLEQTVTTAPLNLHQ